LFILFSKRSKTQILIFFCDLCRVIAWYLTRVALSHVFIVRSCRMQLRTWSCETAQLNEHKDSFSTVSYTANAAAVSDWLTA